MRMFERASLNWRLRSSNFALAPARDQPKGRAIQTNWLSDQRRRRQQLLESVASARQLTDRSSAGSLDETGDTVARCNLGRHRRHSRGSLTLIRQRRKSSNQSEQNHIARAIEKVTLFNVAVPSD